MTSRVRPAVSSSAAGWLLDSAVDWWTLVRCGPPGFDAYVRIAFGDHGADAPDSVQVALEVLGAFTGTPDSCVAAVWEGWCGSPVRPAAPRVAVPNREMLVFEAPLTLLRDAPALAWSESYEPGTGVAPHLAWPQDRAWCLACEVDEEIEFTVGCSAAAADALAAALPGRTWVVSYGAPAPLYRDEL